MKSNEATTNKEEIKYKQIKVLNSLSSQSYNISLMASQP